jgi:hypothetical protein
MLYAASDLLSLHVYLTELLRLATHIIDSTELMGYGITLSPGCDEMKSARSTDDR